MQSYEVGKLSTEEVADILEAVPESAQSKEQVGEFTVTKVVHPTNGEMFIVDAALSNALVFLPKKAPAVA